MISLYSRQGDVCDSWLITAMNVLGVELSQYIKAMFITTEIPNDGKYTMKMYSKGSEEIIEIDDYFPCYTSIVILIFKLLEQT